MQCVDITAEGFVITVNAPGGNINQCAYVLQTPQATVSPLVLDNESAMAISIAIMGTWAVACGLRALINLMRNS